MRAAIYNPYLDTLGGGEKYTMTVARILADAGYSVDVEWKDDSMRSSLEERFGLSLGGINFKNSVAKGDSYELCFWVSDGSIPLLKARHNFLHFQMPFKSVNGRSLFNRIKLFRINKLICNSYFTKKFIDSEFSVESAVLYPPVNVDIIKPRKKENLIVYVGRFSQLTQAKRQDILIDAFQKFTEKVEGSWKLILAGGSEVGAGEYLKTLKQKSAGLNLEVVESPTLKYLHDLYSRARFFWSAAGYKIDENKEPAKVEHFGISLVEAMAAGVIPFVYEAGGPKEIIKTGVNGYFWKDIDGLVEETIGVLGSVDTMKKISLGAVDSSKLYSIERFRENARKLLGIT